VIYGLTFAPVAVLQNGENVTAFSSVDGAVVITMPANVSPDTLNIQLVNN